MNRRFTLHVAMVTILVVGFLFDGPVRARFTTLPPAADRSPEQPILLFETPSVERAADPVARLEAEQETILEVVRQHRGGASEAWRQRLAQAIHEEAVAAGVDPLLIASIVARESSFKSQVVSHAGAVGLMQLRPFVAKDVATRSGVAWDGVRTLHSPELNVRLGIRYLQQLEGRFDGDTLAALTAYNRGPTRVSRQMKSGTFTASRYAERIVDLYAELDRTRSERLAAST